MASQTPKRTVPTTDFRSSLYLGMQHRASSLHPWSQLTAGTPAALAEPPGARRVAAELARLIGCEQATLGRSTLHLFWDLFGLLAAEPAVLLVDSEVYPVARWGVERAAGRGVPVHYFSHRDPAALAARLGEVAQAYGGRRRCIVVVDGLCHCCGRTAPLAPYLELVRRIGGLLVLDDTQALGLLGPRPGPDAPYGRGGGGSLQAGGLAGSAGDQVLVIASLAKAFGAPLAILAGSRALVASFEAQSETRVHSSPPSVADIHAAQRALAVNAVAGDELRFQLAQRVHHFHRRLTAAGLDAGSGIFPVRTVRLPTAVPVKEVHAHLLRRGIRTVLRRAQGAGEPRLSLIITVRHRADEIDHAVEVLAQTARMLRMPALEGP